jgi:methyl-accepting chemotaxis protein
LTRRVAGPLYRLGQTIQEWAKGNLRWRMEFRASDRLDELAATANQALDNIEESFALIQRHNAAMQAVLSKAEADPQAGMPELRRATGEIADVLKRFQFRGGK